MNDMLTDKHCEKHDSPQDYEGRLLIINPERIKEQFRNPVVQYFYATGGFGCKPGNGDKKVFGYFLADGQKDQLYRSDFLGVANRKQLPKWAAKRLEILEAPKLKIRIFQLKNDADTHFMSYDHTTAHSGVKAENYRQVYGGEVLADGLDGVFALCNSDHPPGYSGHSLSVSDVVEVCEGMGTGFYFVDAFGFKKLDDFDIQKTDHSKMMKILVLENDRLPYTAEIRHDGIEAMQSVVGGNFETVYFEPKGDAVCWCNDEFLLNGSAPNRKIGEVLVHGTCFISGDKMNAYGEYDSCSLTDEQIVKYTQMFAQSVICMADLEVDETEEMSEDIGQNLN
ncbi:protein of unknown function [Ruminococcus sp. YE71]|uniref:YodL domain-containing protein n=1 Tax=unclassified Ruminococcus TaxID=2608920 RepID=UPI000883E243|nr:MULTISPECIES: YodL domain-containing protein [unclassified Ruminococcus]SDA30276.1 protein of unknown function [Ruminococcus sp. YE78]SFW49339.1 protein of unknown function [Ruminococcus sp. YE71]